MSNFPEFILPYLPYGKTQLIVLAITLLIVLEILILVLFIRNLRKMSREKNPELFVIFVAICFFGYTLFVIYSPVFNVDKIAWKGLGEFGDAFGFLTAIFTGSGLILILKSLNQHEKTANMLNEANNLNHKMALQARLQENLEVRPSFDLTFDMTGHLVGGYFFWTVHYKATKEVTFISIYGDQTNDKVKISDQVDNSFCLAINYDEALITDGNLPDLRKIIMSGHQQMINIEYVNSLGIRDELSFVVTVEIENGQLRPKMSLIYETAKLLKTIDGLMHRITPLKA